MTHTRLKLDVFWICFTVHCERDPLFTTRPSSSYISSVDFLAAMLPCTTMPSGLPLHLILDSSPHDLRESSGPSLQSVWPSSASNRGQLFTWLSGEFWSLPSVCQALPTSFLFVCSNVWPDFPLFIIISHSPFKPFWLATFPMLTRNFHLNQNCILEPCSV